MRDADTVANLTQRRPGFLRLRHLEVWRESAFHIADYKLPFVTTKVARLETTKTRSHKGTKKRKSFEILGVLSVFVPLW